MTIGKIRIVSINDTPGVQSKGVKPLPDSCIPAKAATAEEGLRLIQAFSQIEDPSHRVRLIEAAEDFARTNRISQVRSMAARGCAAEDSNVTPNGFR
jgi:hypothetical protein